MAGAPSSPSFYQDPAWVAPVAARPTHVVQTPMGPMAVGALPDGWAYDQFGHAYMTDGNGQRWTYDEDGVPATLDYEEDRDGTLHQWFGIGTSEKAVIVPATKDDIKAERVPKSLIRRQYQTSVQASLDEAGDETGGGPFGVTSPGSMTQDNFSAGWGGPLNNPNFLGSELIREETAAQNPSWSSTQVDEYVQSYSGRKSLARQASRAYYDKDQAGTIYQRFALQRAMSEGWGRPQYDEGEVAKLLNMDKTELMMLQQQMMRAKIPGASTITIGYIGQLSGEDDPTLVAFRNLLSAANLRTVPYDAYLDEAVKMANLAERAALADGSPGDPKFDPTKVSSVVNLTGRGRARSQLKAMMTAMLGRAPTEAEVDAYTSKLNAKEEADPSVRTTTYTRSGDSSSVTEDTDVDPVLIAERAIKGQSPKEYKEYQELQYYNSMLQMMGGA